MYSAPETFKKLNIVSHRAHAIEPEKTVQVGSFRVMAFDVIHDCVRPYGFLVNHSESGNILFFTDTGYLQHKFSNITQIIGEINYSDEILEANISSGRLHGAMRKRVYNTHMSLSVMLGVLEANDLSKVVNIVLIHLSDTNSDSIDFRQRVIDQTGKSVFVAEPGMTIPFNLTPF